MVLVSACLLGEKTRYNGTAQLLEIFLRDVRYRDRLLAVCPECAGGLDVPRSPAEIKGGSGADVLAGTARVVDRAGHDQTQPFIDGAEQALLLAKRYGVRYAILKERSPSCGVHQIYDGSFQGNKRGGQGVCAALLQKHHIQVFSDEELTEDKLRSIMEIKS